MRTFLWVVLALDQVALLLIASVNLEKFELSEFAFKQKLLGYSSTEARLFKRLYKNLPNIQVFQKLELVILGSLSVALLSHLQQPVAIGVVFALLAFLVISLLSKLKLVRGIAETAFERSLEFILSVVEFLRPVLSIFSTVPTNAVGISSHEEFADILRRLPSTVLSPIQRQRLESVLLSEEKTVRDIMTPKKRAVIIEPSATLGPIVLSDLQKSGHGYFPVATKKGEPQGILALSDVADVQLTKKHTLVSELMSSHIAWAEEGTSLFELAEAFLEDKQYIVLVRNYEGEFSGLVTIADLMKHLLGIVKE